VVCFTAHARLQRTARCEIRRHAGIAEVQLTNAERFLWGLRGIWEYMGHASLMNRCQTSKALDRLACTSDEDLLRIVVQRGEDVAALVARQRARISQRLADVAHRVFEEGVDAWGGAIFRR
jgi:hypothetical protein